MCLGSGSTAFQIVVCKVKIDPTQRYYNIIRQIDVDVDDNVYFYFTGYDRSFSVVDFIAGTDNHKRLSVIESRIRSHNRKERKRYHQKVNG